MTKLEQAAKIALNVLENKCDPKDEVVIALREALAEPAAQWVGLTDEEYTELWGMKPDLLNFFRKIEAKLKEKNHG